MPIHPADYAASPSTGNGTSANHGSQKRKRKHSMAGYQVEQTTGAASILTKHQQLPEQPLVPPIKQRRVHDGRRMVFGEQPTQEPMETEPAISARTESLPVAVFWPLSENPQPENPQPENPQPENPQPENPQPTSGNILSTISETTQAPVRENIESMEDDDPGEIPSEVLSMFLPEHQEALREHLINDTLETRQRWKMVVNNAEKLLKLLRERQIELSKNRSKPPFPTLFAQLKAYSITESPELFSTYFAKASVFFSVVNTDQIKNTGCLTSMLHHKSQIKGFTEQSEEVIRVIASQPFLKQISSMRNGYGFPSREKVATFMSIPCLKQGWQPGCDGAVQGKHIDRELLAHIAGMNNGKGFPSEAHTRAFVRWLPRESKKHCLKVASRVFRSSRLPEQSVLTANERTLRQYLHDLPEYFIDSDDDISDSDNEPDHARAEDQQMKVLALFCSAPKKWRLNFAEFEQYLTSFTNAGNNDRTQVLSALASLISILFNHGGAGVSFWLARHNDNQQDRRLLTQALSISAPLDTVKFALTQLPESECLAYMVLCTNLSPAVNKAQWDALKPLREQLDQRFKMVRSKKMMLEILWSLPEAKRSGYGENLDSFFDIVFDIVFDVVFEIVPTIRQLYRIHQAFGPEKMQGFLDACLAKTIHAETLKVKAQELLMEGLLLIHHYLGDHGHIPDLCFSSQVASRNGKGVVINGDAAMPGNRRLWNFITAMLIELGQTPEYKFEKQQLTVLTVSGPVVLPKPEFSLAGSGFVINNWSLEQVQTFFKATEFTERWYKKPGTCENPA